MKFKIDENLPVEAAETLRRAGHDAATIVEQRMAGAPDQQLFTVIVAEARILVTLDLGFANIRAYPPASGPGVVVLRLGSQGKTAVMTAIERLLDALAVEPPTGRLWIIDEDGRLRVRS
jgi:predicted nuclease of predicted toxin-antitoxin system